MTDYRKRHYEKYAPAPRTRVRLIDVVKFEYNHWWIDARRFPKDAFGFLVPMGYCIGGARPKAIEITSKWDWKLETFRKKNCLTPEIDSLRHIKPTNLERIRKLNSCLTGF